MFQRADLLLFKEKNFSEAEKVYRQILESDARNIDALNSIAYCIRYRILGVDQERSLSEEENRALFSELHPLYNEILR
jgi:hypothetical protein